MWLPGYLAQAQGTTQKQAILVTNVHIFDGAHEGLVLVDGNPLEHIDLIVDPAQHFVLIMKDGMMYKNILK